MHDHLAIATAWTLLPSANMRGQCMSSTFPKPAEEESGFCNIIRRLWCPLQVRAPAEAACGDYDVYTPGMTFVPTLRALPSAQLVVTQPYDTHVSRRLAPTETATIVLPSTLPQTPGVKALASNFPGTEVVGSRRYF